MNIRLRLAEEELEGGAAGGPTLELVFEKEQEEEVEEEKARKGQRLMENDVTDSCSARSAQTHDSDARTDTNP